MTTNENGRRLGPDVIYSDTRKPTNQQTNKQLTVRLRHQERREQTMYATKKSSQSYSCIRAQMLQNSERTQAETYVDRRRSNTVVKSAFFMYSVVD